MCKVDNQWAAAVQHREFTWVFRDGLEEWDEGDGSGREAQRDEYTHIYR